MSKTSKAMTDVYLNLSKVRKMWKVLYIIKCFNTGHALETIINNSISFQLRKEQKESLRRVLYLSIY